jgi:isopenicillin-N N-acyltransferase-like protein
MKKFFIIYLLFLAFGQTISAEVVRQSGNGYLEIIDGQQILHLKGNPYEIGYQHGSLLKEQIAHNLSRFIDNKLSTSNAPQIVQTFTAIIPQIISYIPNALIQEMKGLSDGSGLSYDKILLLNLFPEMFHCSAITVGDKATKDQVFYHVRVLDYAVGISLQDTAILAVVEPQEGHAFINVTYAGFIGTVTGMNEQKIGIGEIGGKGYGSWSGLPMAFLLRHVLQYASSIEEIRCILERTPRTCEYYYIFSDGKNQEALAVYATAQQLAYISPGTAYSLSSAQNGCHNQRTYQQPEASIVLTRGEQYQLLSERLMAQYGHITINDLIEAIKQPVAHTTNLHNAIFAPESLEIWISHAGPHNEPACDQPYHHFEWKSLFQK